MIDTYAVITKSNLVLNDVIQRMGLDMTYSQLADSSTVGSVNSTQIMAITVTNENPGGGQDLRRRSRRLRRT